MRSFLALSLSAAVLSGCLTSQENPNYEHSTTYRGDAPAQNQYAVAAPAVSNQYAVATPAAPTGVSYDPAPVQSYPVQAASTSASYTSSVAPTDSLYGSNDVTGTPGYMAMQSSQPAATTQPVTTQAVAQALPTAEYVSTAPLGAAGTPIAYDYSRNLIAVDAVTTDQYLPDTVRVFEGTGQNYIVKQGDTVYGLSRKTCVGVQVIQSMNGLSSNYAIKIGQSLTLPASVC